MYPPSTPTVERPHRSSVVGTRHLTVIHPGTFSRVPVPRTTSAMPKVSPDQIHALSRRIVSVAFSAAVVDVTARLVVIAKIDAQRTLQRFESVRDDPALRSRSAETRDRTPARIRKPQLSAPQGRPGSALRERTARYTRRSTRHPTRGHIVRISREATMIMHALPGEKARDFRGAIERRLVRHRSAAGENRPVQP